MNEIYKAIEHFEHLQKRYTTQHNGKHCELVKTALAALREKADKKEGVFAQNVYTKLAAYEDTGLTPEQIQSLAADKDEQARKTRQLEEGLRSTLKVLETLNYRGGLGLDIHKWLRDEMQTVNALLGGKEDETGEAGEVDLRT